MMVTGLSFQSYLMLGEWTGAAHVFVSAGHCCGGEAGGLLC